MKIRFGLESQTLPKESGLLPGAIYLVLGMVIDLESKITALVVLNDDLKSPVRIEAAVFDVIDDLIPSSWENSAIREKVVIAPKEWSNPLFWDDYFEGQMTAIETFNAALPNVLYELTGSICTSKQNPPKLQ